MEFNNLLIETSDNVATLTVNRPKDVNLYNQGKGALAQLVRLY